MRARRIKVIFELAAAASHDIQPECSRSRDHTVAEMRVIDRRCEHHWLARDLRDPRRRHPVASPILLRGQNVYSGREAGHRAPKIVVHRTNAPTVARRLIDIHVEYSRYVTIDRRSKRSQNA